MPPRRSKRVSDAEATAGPSTKRQREDNDELALPPDPDTSFTDSFLPHTASSAASSKADERAAKAAAKARAKAEKDAIKAEAQRLKDERKRIKDEEKRVKDEQKRVKAEARAKKQAAKAEQEERLNSLRAFAPPATVDRLHRVMTQRMYMVERESMSVGGRTCEKFAVLGSTGNIYTVHIKATPTCDCPDFIRGNRPCKHVIFVFIKVLKVAEDAHVWFQRTVSEHDLSAVFAAAPDSSAMASDQVRNAYLAATGRVQEPVETQDVKDVVGEDCPICFEEMTEEDVESKKLSYDTAGCGNALHTDCFNMWSTTATKKGDTVTCVYCRGAWFRSRSGKTTAPVFGRGYINITA